MKLMILDGNSVINRAFYGIKLLTTKKERTIHMSYTQGQVSKTTRILFPIVVTILAGLVAPRSVALVGFLMFGNLIRECGVLNSLSDTAQNVLANLITAAHAKGALVTAVADLLAEKYLSTFLPLLPPNTDPADFKPVFIEAFRNMPMLHDRLSGEVKSLAGSYLTELKVQDVTYDIGKIDIGGDVVDMLCENLDSEGTPNPKNTLHLYGSITSALPVSLRLVPYFSPTNVRFDVTVEPGKTNEIRETQLFESDLRQIIEGAEIILPVSLEKYYPGYDFTSDQQIVITLRLIKRGGLKLNL